MQFIRNQTAKNHPFNNTHRQKGVTLIELVTVIVLLGIMAVGITGFISLSTQTYVNVSERDELLASARFAVERLNREIRNAVPNSVLVVNGGTLQCIEFIPIMASTTYIDIPVAPDPASNSISVIPFYDDNGNAYECDECNDNVLVYPINTIEVYGDNTDNAGMVFEIDNFINPPVFPPATQWDLPLRNTVTFDSESPLQRAYIANTEVIYCYIPSALELRRWERSLDSAQLLPPSFSETLMAENMVVEDTDHLPFTISPATLKRNALVQVRLKFERDGESFVFENEIHIANMP